MDELRRHVEALRAVHLPELPPFCSGAVGYAGYDTVRYFERLPNAPPDDRQVPDLAFAFYDQMVVFDHVTKTIVVVAMARLDQPGATRRGGLRRRPAARRRPGRAAGHAVGRAWTWSTSGRRRREARIHARISPSRSSSRRCEKCVEYIRAGDIFQVVLSQRLEVPLTAHPFEIYRTLRVVNPSPFMFYVRTPSVTLVGSFAGGDGPRGRRAGDRPPAGRHPPPRPDGGGRPPPGRGVAGRSQGAGRARHAGRSGPQRRGPRLPLPHACDVERRDDHRALQPRDAHHLERQRPAGARARAPSTPCRPACPPAPSPARRRCGRWRSSTSWSRIAAGPMPGRSATSISAATWTPASPCGRWSCRATRAYVQAGAGIVADSVPANEWQETLNKARGLLKAIELAQPPAA